MFFVYFDVAVVVIAWYDTSHTTSAGRFKAVVVQDRGLILVNTSDGDWAKPVGVVPPNEYHIANLDVFVAAGILPGHKF